MQDNAAAQQAATDEKGTEGGANSGQETAEASTAGGHVAAAGDKLGQSHDRTDSFPLQQQQQPRTDAQADSVLPDSEAQLSESGSQQGEEKSWQESMGGKKPRAVDVDYNVSTGKAGRKGQAKGVKKAEPQVAASNAAAFKSPERKVQLTSTDTNGQPEAGNAILPPKPKPGAPKARKAPQPVSDATDSDATQPSGLPAQPRPPSATPSQPPAAAQRPVPQQTSAQSPTAPAQGPVQIPSAPQAIYKPAPAAIPLAANSAWAKKLDLQPAAPAATPARPTPTPSQPPPATPAPAAASRQATSQPPPVASIAPAATAASVLKAAASNVKAAPTIKATDRPLSAVGAKGKGKKKGQGQGASKQPSTAQPSAPPAASSGQCETVVKEVPANSKDSRPRASNSTVLSTPGLTDKQPSTSAGLQGQPLPDFSVGILCMTCTWMPECR